MATTAEILDNAIRAAGIPIIGVSIGLENDRLTWSIQFDPSATAQQRTQAATILASVAVDATAQRNQDKSDVKAFIDNMSLVEKAIDLTLLDLCNLLGSRVSPQVAVTPQQFLNQVKAKVDSL